MDTDKRKFPGRSAVHVRITGCYDKDFAPERYHQHQMVIVRETCTEDETCTGAPREYAAISSQPGGGAKGYTACRWFQTCRASDIGPRVPERCYDALCGSEAQRPQLFLYW